MVTLVAGKNKRDKKPFLLKLQLGKLIQRFTIQFFAWLLICFYWLIDKVKFLPIGDT